MVNYEFLVFFLHGMFLMISVTLENKRVQNALLPYASINKDRNQTGKIISLISMTDSYHILVSEKPSHKILGIEVYMSMEQFEV